MSVLLSVLRFCCSVVLLLCHCSGLFSSSFLSSFLSSFNTLFQPSSTLLNLPLTLQTFPSPQFGRFPGDTGYTPVQIAVLTARIDALRSHVSFSHKDNHSKRGLQALVTRRRKLLQYFEKKNFDEYANIVRALKLKPVS